MRKLSIFPTVDGSFTTLLFQEGRRCEMGVKKQSKAEPHVPALYLLYQATKGAGARKHTPTQG